MTSRCAGSKRDFDVLIASDFRHAGGTAASIEQEVEIQARMGLSTGLIQIDAPHMAAKSFAGRIRSLVVAGLAELVSADRPVTARLLVLRHPRVFERSGWTLAARGDHTLMVASQVPQDAAQRKPYYSVSAVEGRLAEELGTSPLWAPIGPMVRDSLTRLGKHAPELTETDWQEVIDVDAWTVERPRERSGPLVLGRHSRDNVKKWPETKEAIFAAYPRSGDYQVRILGGCKAVKMLTGSVPMSWDVLPFGSMAPRDFLATLDVFVYLHHTGMEEAFCRVVLEALAAGLPVITHPYFEKLFDDTCLYAEPGDVLGIVDEIAARKHPRVNRAGIGLVRERYDWEAHRQRIDRYLQTTTSRLSRRPKRKKRVLLMSSNGGGMGHLTRLLGIARRLPDDHEALFLTMSTGIEAVRKQGFWADYLPGPQSGELRGNDWLAYLQERMVAALRHLAPEAFVFDGTFAHWGLTDALDQFPWIHKTWSRRGMWQPVSTRRAKRALSQAQSFDLIIEPGELATEVDGGVTSEQRHLLRQLEPMLLLEDSEMLSPRQARRELGIPEDRVAVLLNLGAGNINSIDNLMAAVAQILRQHPDVHIVALQSLIAAADLPDSDRITKLQTYPLARLLRAFDVCVAAPGYNSFHELLTNAIPTVFIPNEQTVLDDQRARAVWAHDAQLARLSLADDPDSLREALAALLDADTRQAMRERLLALPTCRGAKQAVDLIVSRERSVTRVPAPKWKRALASVGHTGVRPLVDLVRRLDPRARAGGSLRGDRVLLIVDLETPPSDAAALIEQHTRRGQPPLLMVRGAALTSFAQHGVTAEMLLDRVIDPSADGLDKVAYLDQKIHALVTAYGIGKIVCLGDAALSRRLAELLGSREGSRRNYMTIRNTLGRWVEALPTTRNGVVGLLANIVQLTEMRAMLERHIAVSTRHELMTQALVRTLLLQDGRKRCPLCERESAAFLPFGPRLRLQAQCPSCGSLERHRLLWLYFQRETKLLDQPTRVLHFAPERCLSNRLQEIPEVEHVTTDLDAAKAMHQEDIQKLSFDDASFDAVICSHVLEHVPDDRRALREIRRVLRPNGWAVLMVPVDMERASTYEDASVVTPRERKKHFGQSDHVRIYGRDIQDRIAEAGFGLRIERLYETLDPDEVQAFGIRDEVLYHCTK